MALEPVDSFVYVANAGSNNISGFKLSSGVLAPLPGLAFAAGMQPSSVAVDPTGKFAYAANSGSGNISAYAVDAATGELTNLSGSPFPVGLLPAAIAVTN